MARSKLAEVVARRQRETGEKITGETIARLAGLNVGTVSRWMQPEPFQRVDIDTVVKIASVLNVTWYELIDVQDIGESLSA